MLDYVLLCTMRWL